MNSVISIAQSNVELIRRQNIKLGSPKALVDWFLSAFWDDLPSTDIEPQKISEALELVLRS